MVNITVNGESLSVEKGTILLKACEDNGFPIPHLCFKDGLSSVGSCRLCLVKIEGQKKLAASCVTPVQEGMRVVTDDERLRELRRVNLKLILSEHEHNCLTCEKSGNCELQDLAYALDIKSIGFEINQEKGPVEDSSEVIARNPNLCILCGRCVRACSEIAGRNILGFANRGAKLTISADIDDPLALTECASCGACLQACPTGALTEKLARLQARSWDLTTVRTTCTHCGGGCQLKLGAYNNKIVRVRGVEDTHAENGGHLCVKGRFGMDFVQSPQRLRHPLVKKNGTFVKASWDEALDLVSSNFKRIIDQHGSDLVGGIASAKTTNEDNYVFQKFLRACIGTNNIDFCTRFCHTPSAVALSRAFGGGAMTNSTELYKQADVLLVAGLNLTEMYPVFADFVKSAVARGELKLIVIDPRKTELVDYAQVWIRPKLGTDIAWINGMINVILEENLQDATFIADRTEGFDELKSVIATYTPQKVKEITGVAESDIVAAARLYGQASRAAILYGMGITQHIHGTDNVSGLCNLALVTGNLGKAGTGVNTIAKQNNGQGAGDMGCLPPIYPGGQKVADPQSNEKFEKAWGTSLSKKPGMTESDMVLDKGRLKGLFVLGGNPMRSGPNVNKVQEVLEGMDFVVVQDMFMTETAEMADVVLPACSFAEKDGTFTNVSRLVQRVRKIIEPQGESKPDWEIICQLSTRMGYDMNYAHPEQIMDEISTLTPPYGGISYQRLEASGLRWPCPSAEHPGTPFLWEKKFNTPTGRGQFFPAEYQRPAELPDEEYPFALTTGKNLYHLHTGSYTQQSVALSRLASEDRLEMNPSDAERLGVVNGEKVKVCSRRGTIGIKVKVADRVSEGTVFTTFHSSAVNQLTNDSLDALAKAPELKICGVKIEKVA